MKVVLVNPYWTSGYVLPLNLAELAGYLRKWTKAEVTILDLNHTLRRHDELSTFIQIAVGQVLQQQPDLIGITCNAINVPFCSLFIPALKKKTSTPVVLGGLHPTFRPNAIAKLTGADFLVRGEGEETLADLVLSLENDRTFSDIPGLTVQRNGSVSHNPRRKPFADLSNLSFPGFDLLPDYDPPSGRPLDVHVIASRGCAYRCLFCSSAAMWPHMCYKEPTRILDEIRAIRKRWPVPFFSFSDNSLTTKKSWLHELIGPLKKEGVDWKCFSRIEEVDRYLLTKLRNHNCRCIFHGIESGNSKVRKRLKRGNKLVSNESIIRIVDYECRLGLNPICSFMAGIPFETESNLWETIHLAEKLKDIGARVQYWIMTPYPGTPAKRLFPGALTKVDRWRNLRQFDVHGIEQRLFYNNVLKDPQVEEENPDAFFFLPRGLTSEEFFEIYRAGLKVLGTELPNPKAIPDFQGHIEAWSQKPKSRSGGCNAHGC